MEAEGGHPFLLRNFVFYFEIFHLSMEYLTTKILYPTITGNMSLHSILRDGSRYSLHFIELNTVKR